MENFFIFLDIDGTLWDSSKFPFSPLTQNRLDKNSINATNNLIYSLQKRNFNPVIVVISKRRVFWEHCQSTLYANGIDPEIPMLKLPIGKFSRGERISIFMYDYSKNKDLASGERSYSCLDKVHFNYINKVNNYVVIDDNKSALKNIPSTHHIKPYAGKSLNQEMIDNFLECLDNDFELLEK